MKLLKETMADETQAQMSLERSREQRLENELAEYLRQVEQGVNVDQEAMLAAHPDLADDLREFFVNHDRINRLAAPMIASVPLKAEFAKVATPVLTSFVYNEAEVRNTSPTVLLAGPVTAYVDGSFVGGSELPTIASGEAFVVGLGIDSSLRVSRELLARGESIQGGNRVVELTYRLSLENFSETPSVVRLIDRLPQAKDGQVRVTAGAMPPTSTDSEYVKTQKKTGILRWDVTVPANARGTDAYATEFSFKLEYDKQMNLSGM